MTNGKENQSPKPTMTDEEQRLKSDAKQKKKDNQQRKRQKKALKKKLRKQPIPYEQRVIAGKKWLSEYNPAVPGKNIIKNYRHHFRIEAKVAFEDIKSFGYPLTEVQIKRFHEGERNKVIFERNRKRNRRARLEARREARKNGISHYDMFPDSDDRFFMIMGYTSGGAPYGLTWEETYRFVKVFFQACLCPHPKLKSRVCRGALIKDAKKFRQIDVKRRYTRFP